MIARPLRLQRSYEFARVRKQGRSWTTPLLVLAVQPNHLGHNRYGFAVGRRIGKAARRNRVKRRLREVARRLHPQLAQGYDLVFVARGPLADMSVPYEELAEAARTLCTRAGLLESRRGPRNDAAPDAAGPR